MAADVVWVLAGPRDKTLLPVTVASTRLVVSTGMFAPLTLSGSLIVDNVAASVHRCACCQQVNVLKCERAKSFQFY